MHKRYFIFLLILLHFSFFIFAQTDSSHLKISLLTCAPGEDLYSTWGHSALRVTDSITSDDIVFNYGTFDFDEPGFYLKFIRGKLMYYVSTEEFDSFKNFYQQENRGITEQVLNLTPSEKHKIKQLLLQNLESENRFYKYDFLFDNCTTRLRDLVEKTADSAIVYENILAKKTSFRELIYEYLDYGDKQWSKLGIDLFLGSKTDAIMTNRQVAFLPDYLMKTLDHTKIGDTPIVLSSKSLYPTSAKKNIKKFFGQPQFIFSVFFLIIILLSFSKNNAIQKFVYNFDGFIFFLTGLLGIIMLFMWFGTDHIMCRNNYNLLWAWPTHAIAAFFINSKKKITAIYFKVNALINSLVLLLWFLLSQQINTSLIPFLMILIFRSAIISYGKRNNVRLWK